MGSVSGNVEHWCTLQQFFDRMSSIIPMNDNLKQVIKKKFLVSREKKKVAGLKDKEAYLDFFKAIKMLQTLAKAGYNLLPNEPAQDYENQSPSPKEKNQGS